MSTATTKHPIDRIWDVVPEVAVDGTMSGKLDVPVDGAVTGRMTLTTEDGRRFSVHVDEVSND